MWNHKNIRETTLQILRERTPLSGHSKPSPDGDVGNLVLLASASDDPYIVQRSCSKVPQALG